MSSSESGFGVTETRAFFGSGGALALAFAGFFTAAFAMVTRTILEMDVR
ncbi:MAG: hypothetical protein AMXMBFR74_02470 [Parvibaculum sp.]